MPKYTDGPAYQTNTADDIDTGLPAGCALMSAPVFLAFLVVLWWLSRFL